MWRDPDYGKACTDLGEWGVAKAKAVIEQKTRQPSIALRPSDGLRRLQIQGGDLLFEHANRSLLCEVKTEHEWTGNLCWEVWSDEPSQTKGWGQLCEADLLANLYQDRGVLLMFRTAQLRAWIARWSEDYERRVGIPRPFGHPTASLDGRQHNRTAYWLVPFASLLADENLENWCAHLDGPLIGRCDTTREVLSGRKRQRGLFDMPKARGNLWVAS